MISPEGTRVQPGETPPLRSGFAGLYRALGLPVVPVAVDSGRLWGGGPVQRRGPIRFVGRVAIPPGPGRDAVGAPVHAALNAPALAPEAGAQPFCGGDQSVPNVAHF